MTGYSRVDVGKTVGGGESWTVTVPPHGTQLH